MLGNKSSRQNFKAAKIFTMNDRVMQTHDLRENKILRQGLDTYSKAIISLHPSDQGFLPA